MTNLTCQITTLTLTNSNTQINIIVTLSNSQVVTLPSLSYDGTSPVDAKALVIAHVQRCLDKINGKVLNDYANDLKAIVFSS